MDHNWFIELTMKRKICFRILATAKLKHRREGALMQMLICLSYFTYDLETLWSSKGLLSKRGQLPPADTHTVCKCKYNVNITCCVTPYVLDVQFILNIY